MGYVYKLRLLRGRHVLGETEIEITPPDVLDHDTDEETFVDQLMFSVEQAVNSISPVRLHVEAVQS